MTRSIWTLDRFRRAGVGHLRSAEHVLEKAKSRTVGEPSSLPGSAAYLAHLALECVLKAHLLARGGCASAEVLERRHPRVHDALFKGRRGHNLKNLADQIRIESVLNLAGAKWNDDATWKRMAADDRPYTLRYGVEQLSPGDAENELKRASALLATLVRGTRTVPLDGNERRRRR